MNHFKGKQFQKDVIIISVGYYLRYNLSYRDVQEMLYDRGMVLLQNSKMKSNECEVLDVLCRNTH